jgi:hypothetical protein
MLHHGIGDGVMHAAKWIASNFRVMAQFAPLVRTEDTHS